MRFSSGQRFVPVVAALAALAGVLIGATAPKAQTPTAEQLKVYQSLPQDQRDAIMQQVGGQVPGGTAPAPANSQIVVTEPMTSGVAVSENRSLDTTQVSRQTKIKGLEQVLIEVLPTPPFDQLLPADARKLDELHDRILARNPYELTGDGVLFLPGFAPIVLAGLTPPEAQQRVAIEPLLRDFKVTLRVLRVDAQGPRALKPFGYDMFRAGALATVPGTDIPVPADYQVGSGDVFDVQLYGQQSKTYILPVGRDGTVSFPDLGPISVAGRSFSDAQSLLEKKVHQQLIGTQARVKLSELRSMRILVVGDAEKPGSYVVSGLSGVTNALFASGGVRPIGSLRKIELRRQGRLIRRLDVYDVLLRGDNSNDVVLQSGDVVFVPPTGATVGISGEIQRPAIYELAEERTLAELVALAGGLSPNADSSLVTIERVGERGDREAIDADLSASGGRELVLRSGDMVHVATTRPVLENGIALEGNVHRPGTFAWRKGIRLSDVIRSIDELKVGADQHYVLIKRQAPNTRRVEVLSADLDFALSEKGSAHDIALEPRDRITIFDLVSPRDRVIGPILDELRNQARPDRPASVVSIDGKVNSPGTYPLQPNMRVSDLLRAGGGLQDAAYANGAELARYVVVDGEHRRAEIRQIDLGAVRSGDSSADVLLAPYDLLTIKLTPEWQRQEKIELVGEVRFPGNYLVRRGETLSSALARAGGLTSLAFPQGAVFTREELKQRERDQLDRLALRLQSDLATFALQSSQSSPGSAQAVSAGQGLLDQLRQTKPVGRLVIDVAALNAANPRGDADVTLRNGDRLVVPRATQEVSVLGEVQNPTSHLFHTGQTRDDLIALSGGTTPHADRKRAYVVRADGSVVASGSRWTSSGNVKVQAGDTVVVPMDAEKMRPLPMWTAITTIIYNLAIAAVAASHL